MQLVLTLTVRQEWHHLGSQTIPVRVVGFIVGDGVVGLPYVAPSNGNAITADLSIVRNFLSNQKYIYSYGVEGKWCNQLVQPVCPLWIRYQSSIGHWTLHILIQPLECSVQKVHLQQTLQRSIVFHVRQTGFLARQTTWTHVDFLCIIAPCGILVKTPNKKMEPQLPEQQQSAYQFDCLLETRLDLPLTLVLGEKWLYRFWSYALWRNTFLNCFFLYESIVANVHRPWWDDTISQMDWV